MNIKQLIGTTYIVGCVVCMLAVGLIAVAALLETVAPIDRATPPVERAGLEVFTDPDTGCQYLIIKKSITSPRFDHSGKQMGCAP